MALRNPAIAVEAALQAIPNQYLMCLVAAQHVKTLPKHMVHRIDRALMDIAEGIATPAILTGLKR